MTKEQLKAKAYDCIVNIEYWQNELKKTNESISKMPTQPEQVEDVNEEVVDKVA